MQINLSSFFYVLLQENVLIVLQIHWPLLRKIYLPFGFKGEDSIEDRETPRGEKKQLFHAVFMAVVLYFFLCSSCSKLKKLYGFCCSSCILFDLFQANVKRFFVVCRYLAHHDNDYNQNQRESHKHKQRKINTFHPNA